MILLIVRSDDFIVHEILLWLKFLKKKFIVLNELNYVVDINMSINGDCFFRLKNNQNFHLSEISMVYIRRGKFWFENNLPYKYYDPEKIVDKTIKETQLNKFIKNELNTLEEYLMSEIKEKIFTIGDYNEGDNNKLKTLKIAKKVGLNIPETIILCEKNNLQEHQKLITKAIKEGFKININNTIYNLKTHMVDNESLPNNFAPTLFQKKIEKKFELRIFYLNGLFYSMAIFSQQNQKTQIDFRNYDYNNPNKTTPYKLPNDIERKLIRLMKSLELSTGSIDMIYSKDNEYVFLEVNPTGQFGMVSAPCNYNIEKKIAELL